jgi:hypothetical protein
MSSGNLLNLSSSSTLKTNSIINELIMQKKLHPLPRLVQKEQHEKVMYIKAIGDKQSLI